MVLGKVQIVTFLIVKERIKKCKNLKFSKNIYTILVRSKFDFKQNRNKQIENPRYEEQQQQQRK